jgi:hypothetical protein
MLLIHYKQVKQVKLERKQKETCDESDPAVSRLNIMQSSK